MPPTRHFGIVLPIEYIHLLIMRFSRQLKHITLVVLILVVSSLSAQKKHFTRQDTLRGTITPGREWWDLTHYELSVMPDLDTKTLTGQNKMQYRVLKSAMVMQIDLQPPMQMDKVMQNGQKLTYTHEGNVYFINLTEKQQPGEIKEIVMQYSGKPPVSKNPPWDGGLTWKKDAAGKPFVATSCQGDGASLWWPCKDHGYDEPDSMLIHITVPMGLTAVANGRLRKTEEKDSNTTFTWAVVNPINNYGVNMNIANYTHFSEKYEGKKGVLDCDYYVLPENLAKAKRQFKQVKMMLEAFEERFGPYPFYEDGYKLVEVPYLGMEHQSSVTYGNGYQNGYLGTDLSGTGNGNLFDFIIIHESGHEWFANSITAKDIADMWVHEGFTCYSECLYLEYHFGKKQGFEYVRGLRKNIMNDRPIVGVYGVNYEGSVDMYYKGANMLHTLRQVVNNDSVWFDVLKGLNTTFYHQTVTSDQVENFITSKTRKNLTAFFDQYLRDKRVPELEYKMDGTKLKYRWANCVEGFNMPLKIIMGNKGKWIFPTTAWAETEIEATSFIPSADFYITVSESME